MAGAARNGRNGVSAKRAVKIARPARQQQQQQGVSTLMSVRLVDDLASPNGHNGHANGKVNGAAKNGRAALARV